MILAVLGSDSLGSRRELYLYLVLDRGRCSCSKQPVAAKQRMVSLFAVQSSRKKFLKRGGSFQSKNSEK